MAKRQRFDSERLQRAANDAARAVQSTGAVLSCAYQERPGKVTLYTDVAFEWHVQAGFFESRESVIVRAKNAVTKAVPLPPSWRTAIDCAMLDEKARKSAEEHRDKVGLAELTCAVLGRPKSATPDTFGAGTAVALNTHQGGRIDVLLCAHIENDRWLCHTGTLRDGRIDSDNPFDPDGLADKDIVRDAFDPCAAPVRRIKRHAKLSATNLQEAMRSYPEEWACLVATAIYNAEGIRAGEHFRPFDAALASAGFERNPFMWGTTLRQSNLYVAWSWWSEGWSRAITAVRVDHALHRTLPLPLGAEGSDVGLYEKLLARAQTETTEWKAPCKYLGMRTGAGRYEPDPSKWPSRCYSTLHGKTYAKVFFEWDHVMCGSEKHRVDVCANHAIARGVPRSPLAKHASSGYRFAHEFMDAVAENMKAGSKYKGIAFDSERPEILEQLPDGGLDIQDEPVYWTLPDGRCVCWSLREISKLNTDELTPIDSNEAYLAEAPRMDS